MSVGVSFQKITHLTSFRKPGSIIPQNSKTGGTEYPRGPYLIPLVQTYWSIELHCPFAYACGIKRIIVSIHDAVLFTPNAAGVRISERNFSVAHKVRSKIPNRIHLASTSTNQLAKSSHVYHWPFLH